MQVLERRGFSKVNPIIVPFRLNGQSLNKNKAAMTKILLG
jgi:hypothetical protein